MSYTKPDAILYNGSGVELAVSSSQAISSSQPALLIAGSGSQGVTFLRMTDEGALFVSSSVSPIISASVSISTSVTVSVPTTQSIREIGSPNSFLSSSGATTVSWLLLAANENRRIATVYTDGNKTFFLGFGTPPTTTLYSIRLAAGTFYELPEKFTGPVYVIANAADNNSRIMVTEIRY